MEPIHFAAEQGRSKIVMLLLEPYYKIVSRVSRVTRVILLTLLHLKISQNTSKQSKNGAKRFKTMQNDPKRLKT